MQRAVALMGFRAPAGMGLGALPGLERAHLPGAFVLTGLALQPGLLALIDIAGEEVAAGLPVLAVGRGDRRDGAAGAGRGVFPIEAGVLLAAAEHLAGGGLGIGEVVLWRQLFGVLGARRRRDRAGGGGVAEIGFELVGHAAAAAGDGEGQQCSECRPAP